MYSVVLMTALTAGSASEGFHWGRGCGGCSGCHGCHGYMIVNGNLCSGCVGCHGCYGCSGYGGYAGWGHNGRYAPSGFYGGYAPFGCYGCYGCYGGMSCYGSPLPGHGHIIVDPAPTTTEKKKIEEAPKPKVKEKDEEVRFENRARVIVDLPEDAKLYIDGQLMKTTSARRVFHTPDLVKGQTYYYELKSEVVRGGRPVVETRNVLLRAGEIASTTFTGTETTTASTRTE